MSDHTVTPEILDAFENNLGRKNIHYMSTVQVLALVKTIRTAWAERDTLRGELHALRNFMAQMQSPHKG